MRLEPTRLKPGVRRPDAPVMLSGSGFELSESVHRLPRFVVYVQSYKKDSPSSGLSRVKVYNEHGMAQRNGTGMFPREVVPMPLGGIGQTHSPCCRLRRREGSTTCRCARISSSACLPYGGKQSFPLGSLPQANCTTAWTEMLDEKPAPGGLVPVPAVRAGKFHTAYKLTREASQSLLRAMAHSTS